MATNYVQEGTVIDYTNAGSAISSGDVVVIGSNGDALVGIALGDIANGATGAVQISDGVFEVPKADAAVIGVGEFINWDASAGNFDDNQMVAAAGDVSNAMVAVESKGATTGATIKAKLTGVPGTLA
jgi:predicted RecA/RadA family phage recombinase